MRRFATTGGRVSAVVAALSLMAACGTGSLGGSSGDDDSIKVGLLVSQSGVYSSVGRDMEKGLKWYLAQHDNKIGGKTVRLVTVDEGEAPETGVAGVTRLVQQENVDVVLGVTAGPTATGSRDIFDSAQVPVVLGNTGAVALGEKLASKWIWRGANDNRQPGRVLGKSLAAEAKKTFVIAPDYQGGYEVVDGFKETYPAKAIVGEVHTPFGSTPDFSAYLGKIRASGAEQVFSFYAGGEAIEFTKQFKQFGLSGKVRLYSAGFLTEGAALKAEGDSALGVLNSARYNWDIDNAENKKFASSYEKKFGSVPTVYAATMADVGLIIDTAVAAIDGDVTRKSINAALAKIGTVEGVRGPLSFDDTRTIQQESFYLTEVKKTAQGIRNVTIETLPAR